MSIRTTTPQNSLHNQRLSRRVNTLIKATYSRQQHTARLAVTDAQRAQLMPDAMASAHAHAPERGFDSLERAELAV